ENQMIMSILSEQHSRVLKKDAKIAEFLGEKIKKKNLMPKYIKDIEIEELCQKLAFALTETSEIDYGNKELKQQIFNVIEVHLKRNNTKNTKKEKENEELKVCVRILESKKIEEKGVE
ncbi:30784_t:CDS:2, partial [Gigaspora margarita]